MRRIDSTCPVSPADALKSTNSCSEDFGGALAGAMGSRFPSLPFKAELFPGFCYIVRRRSSNLIRFDLTRSFSAAHTRGPDFVPVFFELWICSFSTIDHELWPEEESLYACPLFNGAHFGLISRIAKRRKKMLINCISKTRRSSKSIMPYNKQRYRLRQIQITERRS